jgi:hypothetical protein
LLLLRCQWTFIFLGASWLNAIHTPQINSTRWRRAHTQCNTHLKLEVPHARRAVCSALSVTVGLACCARRCLQKELGGIQGCNIQGLECLLPLGKEFHSFM